MRTTIILSAMLALTAFSSCKKDDDVNAGGNCFADQITLTQTDIDVYENSHSVFITFDAKNTASRDYDIRKGDKQIQLNVKVTTTDGSVYEETQLLTITDITAGSTQSTLVQATYGAGKTYQSYTYTASCK